MEAKGYITAKETRNALRKLYGEDAETNLREAFLRALSDDLKPIDANGRWKPSTLLMLLGCLTLTLIGIFLYFSLGGQR